MNSEIKLTYTDPENFPHTLRLLKRGANGNFFKCFSIESCKPLELHASSINIHKGENHCRATPELLDALLARFFSGSWSAASKADPLWHTWRQSGPEMRRQIEVKDAAGRTEVVQPHSAGELDSLMQMGFSEWRYL